MDHAKMPVVKRKNTAVVGGAGETELFMQRKAPHERGLNFKAIEPIQLLQKSVHDKAANTL